MSQSLRPPRKWTFDARMAGSCRIRQFCLHHRYHWNPYLELMSKNLHDDSEQSKVQRDAIAAGVQTLAQHDRTRIAMACGVGKTFTQLKQWRCGYVY